MNRIAYTIITATLLLGAVPLTPDYASAEYNAAYRSENAPDVDKSLRTSFYLTDDDATASVAVPAQNADGKLYTSVNILSCSAVEILSLGENVHNIYIEDCPNLNEIHVDDANPCFNELDGVIYNEDMTELIFYSRNKEDKSFTVPDTVTSICDYAFSGNQYLEEIVIQEGVTSLGEYAFSECSLIKIELPHTLETIGSHCFDSNSKLRDITIPEGITVLKYVFADCEALETITFLNPDEIYEPLSSTAGDHLFAYKYAFGERVSSITAYVPDGQTSQYIQMAEDGWNFEYTILPLSHKPTDDLTPTGIAGDVNADGTLNVTDLVILSKWFLNSENSSDYELNFDKTADLNCDNIIDIFDLIIMRRTIISR